MKKIYFSLLILLISLMGFTQFDQLEIGEKAVLTDLKMLDVSGDNISINNELKENGILVLFSCNTCPFVVMWEDRYPLLKEYADKNKVGMIVLNSNVKKRSGDDSFPEMVKHANEKAYNFRYVVDKGSAVANAFGAQTTPHVFLFDRNFNLVYKGAIDDNYKDASMVNKAYLENAMISLNKGEKIALQETPPIGCSIKR